MLPHSPGRVREYSLTATDVDLEVAPGVFFPAWVYNGTAPGPVIRLLERQLAAGRGTTDDARVGLPPRAKTAKLTEVFPVQLELLNTVVTRIRHQDRPMTDG